MKLCIIPARGGSKRIPGKNIKKLAGKPLLEYTIDAALQSGIFDDIVLSSDEESILVIGKNKGIQIDKRPQHLAGDHATKVQVVNEFVNRDEVKNKYDIVAALLPTCPFRTAAHLSEAYQIFKNNKHNVPVLVGVTEYEFPVQLALEEGNKHEMNVFFEDGYKITRSQNLKKMYHPNGAMYYSTMENFLKTNTFFADKMLTYKMDAISSFDIDYPYQFEIAEVLAQKIENKEL